MSPRLKEHIIRNALRGGIVFTLSLMLVLFFRQEIKRLSTSVFETRAKIIGLSNLEDKKKDFQKQLTDVEASTVLIDEAFPPAENPNPFKQILESVSSRTNTSYTIAFKSELAVPSPAFPGYATIPFSLTLTGDLTRFITYLNELQRIKNFIVIQGITLSAEKTTAFTTMHISGFVYVK